MIRVQNEDFDINIEIERLKAQHNSASEIGAIVTFSGTVRGACKNGTLRSMTLEHYPGMTEKELARVETLAHQRWPLHGTTIIHRIGELTPGANIVLVIAAAPHRQAAFEAAEFLMDYLKTCAPFWKKETMSDGSGDWVDARETDSKALARWQ